MKMKLTIIIALTVCLGLVITVNAASMNVDGRLNERIWLSCDSKYIVSPNDISNCGVKYATVTYLFDTSNNLLYIGFKVECNPVTGEILQPGLAVSIDGSDFMTLTTDGVSTYDTYNYSFSGMVHIFNEHSYTAEVALGMKLGIKYGAALALRFMDMDGIPSNVYYDTVPDPPAAQAESTTAVTTQRETTAAPTATEKTTVKVTNAPTEKTTKLKEPKTKAVTTKRVTEKKDETRKIIVQAEVVTVYITVPIYSESYAASEKQEAAQTVTNQKNSDESYQSISFMRKTVTACVIGLIVMSLSFCVAVNVAHDRRMKSKDDKNEQ